MLADTLCLILCSKLCELMLVVGKELIEAYKRVATETRMKELDMFVKSVKSLLE